MQSSQHGCHVEQEVLSHKHDLLSTNSIRITMSYLNLLDTLSNNFTTLYHTRNSDYKDEQKSKHPYSPETLQNNVKITWKTSAHLLCAPIRRIYRGGRRHHADMSLVALITVSCRPRVLPGHKGYMKYKYR